MVYLLNQLVASDGVQASLISNIVDGDKEGLVLAKFKRLEFYEVKNSSGKPQIVLQETLTIETDVGAMAKYRHAGSTRDVLILLTKTYELKVIGYSGGGFQELENMQFDMQGQQQLADEKMRIIVDDEKESVCFLVHCFHSLVQVCRWESTMAVKKRSRGNRSIHTKSKLSMKVVSLGSVAVKQMVFMNDKDESIAILYRDFNYNYSMRYFKIDFEENGMRLSKQFEEFEGVPSNIVPCVYGGMLVLSPTHLYYFAHPSISYVELKDKSDNVFPSGRNVVVKQVNVDSDSYGLEESFDTFCVLDESRILLVSNTGLLYLVYLNITQKSKSLIVNSFSFTKLGMTTIPTTLHHIGKNTFFVSSGMSRSVFFDILSHEPYINITSYLPSTPPLIDINIKNDNDLTRIYTCQGGYHNGEFKRLVSSTVNLVFKERIEANNIFSLTVVERNHKVYLSTTDGSTKQVTFNEKDLRIDEIDEKFLITAKQTGKTAVYITNSYFKIGETITPVATKSAKISPEGAFILINNLNEVHAYFQHSHINHFATADEVSCCDLLYQNGTFLILLGYWSGKFSLHSLSSNMHTPLLTDDTNSSTSIHSCSILKYGEQFQVFISTSNADVLFIELDSSMKTNIHKSIQIPFKSLPFKFTTYGAEVFLHNNERILYVSQVPHLGSIRVGEVFRSQGTLDDFVFLDEFKVLTLTNNKNIDIYTIESSLENEFQTTIFTNHFCQKSLNFPGTDLSIKMCCKLNPDISSSDLEKYYTLELVDNEKMQLLDTVEILNGMVDFEVVSANFAGKFPPKTCFVLRNTVDVHDCIVPYTIKGRKFKKLPNVTLKGIADLPSISFSHIKCLDQEKGVLLLSGNVTFTIAAKEINDELSWVVEPYLQLQLPILPVALSVNQETLVLADINKGMFEVCLDHSSQSNTSKYPIKRIACEIELHFPTCLQVCSVDSETNLLVTGDILGNLLSFDLETKSTQFVCNIGEQINCMQKIPKISTKPATSQRYGHQYQQLSIPLVVFGTVNGALYSLSYTDDNDDDIEDLLSKAQDELIAYSQTLDTIGKSKKFKVTHINGLNSYVSLRRDESGYPSKIDKRGIIDLSIFNKWLQFEYHIANSDPQTPSNISLLKEMSRSLKVCHKNKHLIQRLVYEASLV